MNNTHPQTERAAMEPKGMLTRRRAPARSRKLLSLTLLFALCAVPVRSESAKPLLLKGGTVHTIANGTLSPADVLIRDGKIAEVGENISAGDAEVISIDGRHLYPGLIAPTTSIGLTEISAVRATQDTTESGEYTPDVEAWLSVNPDSELIPVARANGITHALVLPLGGVVSGQSGLIQLTGWTTEELVVQSPVAMHVFWPSMSLDTRPKDQLANPSNWKSPEDQAEERRKRLASLDDFFSEAAAYARRRQATDQTNSWFGVPAWEAMAPAATGDLPLMIHANDHRQIRAAVRWAEKHNYRIMIAGGRDAWKVAELLAGANVPVIYEHTFTQPPRDAESYDVQYHAPAVLHEAGVRVLFSEGPGGRAASSIRNMPYAAAHAVAFGLPTEEALKGMTLYPAEAFGVADRLGSIEPGKEATLFVADGEILDARSTVLQMWIAGKETSLASRHTRLYERYRDRPAR